jgi:hypothetical protein
MKKLYFLLLTAVLCAGSILAEDWVTKVITIKHGNMSQIFHTVSGLLQGSGVLASNDGEHLILSGNKDTVAGFEEMIKQLDVPPAVKKNIETTVYMIVASSQAGSVTPMPAELDPVVRQLKGVFTYKGYRVLDSFVLRSRDGEAGDTSGFVPPLPETNVPASNKIIYQFRYHRVTADGGDGGRVVRFDALKLAMKVPVVVDGKGAINYLDLGIATDVDVPEGKKVVVGKTSAVEGSDGALILVISAKVVD